MLTSKTSQRSYSKSLVEKTKKWLGNDGHKFFIMELLRRNDLILLHSREGMTVRNFLREQKECEYWDAHDFDDNWIDIVKDALEVSNGS